MIKKNLFYNTLLSISQFVFPLITFPYSTRILGPGGIGSVNFIDSFTSYFVLFAALGIPVYGVRETAKARTNQKELNKVVSEIFSIHLLSTGIFASVYIILAMVIPVLRSHLDLVVIGILIMLATVLSTEWVFAGIEQFKYISLRGLTVKTLSVIFLFVFLKKGSPPIVYYSIGASGPVLNSLMNMYFIRKHVSIGFGHLEMKRHLKSLMIILSSSLAVSVYLIMDTIILGFIKGETEVGFYSLALRIVRIPLSIVSAISSVIIPQISMAYKNGDQEKVRDLVNKAFSFISVVCTPIAFGIMISSPFLISTFAGDKFNPSILTLQILSPIIIIIGYNTISSNMVLNPTGNEKHLLKFVVIGMVFSLLTNLVLINLFSYLGAAITNVLTELLVGSLAIFGISRYVKMDLAPDKKIFFQSLFGSALFIPIALTIEHFIGNNLLKEILVIVCCGIFYVLYLWFFVDNPYISSIRQMVQEKLKPGLKLV